MAPLAARRDHAVTRPAAPGQVPALRRLRILRRLRAVGMTLAVAGAAAVLGLVAARPLSAPGVVAGLASLVFVLSVLCVVAGRWVRPPTTAYIARARRLLRDLGQDATVAWEWADYESIAPAMRLAAMAAEDAYFAFHAGFDWDSLRAAYRLNRQPGPIRGGSTISQQVAKNLFLWPARSYLRKALEAYVTVLLEALWTKRRILEVYLNIAQFGANVFGIGAASRIFVGKDAGALTLRDAAVLAAVLPNPLVYRAGGPSHVVRMRQAMILASIKRLPDGYLDYLR
jgi:monofunctional biosynthetic peptidoglycan transglycosylase